MNNVKEAHCNQVAALHHQILLPVFVQLMKSCSQMQSFCNRSVHAKVDSTTVCTFCCKAILEHCFTTAYMGIEPMSKETAVLLLVLRGIASALILQSSFPVMVTSDSIHSSCSLASACSLGALCLTMNLLVGSVSRRATGQTKGTAAC